jgi:site-specific DNA recombinase
MGWNPVAVAPLNVPVGKPQNALSGGRLRPVEETVEAVFNATEPSTAELARGEAASRRLAEAERKLTRFKEALAAGVDPRLVAAWINDAQKEAMEARADKEALTAATTAGPTREELGTLVAGFADLTGRLGRVPVAVRAEIYAQLGVRLTYDPSTASVEAEVSSPHEMWGKTSVRGATRYIRTRLPLNGLRARPSRKP